MFLFQYQTVQGNKIGGGTGEGFFQLIQKMEKFRLALEK